ncbi:hypothetical protein Vafri_2979 [Volvox africanus]|uniref:Uncharacterized protein n=1 Tax=Volvox africanus TaxID=51714 RepID=A0A8J4ATG9_9CHLO|nr:hypothetical protein Vafri_2979 [Volvox africanus]
MSEMVCLQSGAVVSMLDALVAQLQQVAGSMANTSKPVASRAYTPVPYKAADTMAGGCTIQRQAPPRGGVKSGETNQQATASAMAAPCSAGQDGGDNHETVIEKVTQKLCDEVKGLNVHWRRNLCKILRDVLKGPKSEPKFAFLSGDTLLNEARRMVVTAVGEASVKPVAQKLYLALHAQWLDPTNSCWQKKKGGISAKLGRIAGQFGILAGEPSAVTIPAALGPSTAKATVLPGMTADLGGDTAKGAEVAAGGIVMAVTQHEDGAATIGRTGFASTAVPVDGGLDLPLTTGQVAAKASDASIILLLPNTALAGGSMIMDVNVATAAADPFPPPGCTLAVMKMHPHPQQLVMEMVATF